MSYAYTPGLKVKSHTIVGKSRVLPVAGEVLVKKGGIVESGTIIARTSVPGRPHIIPVSIRLGIQERDLKYYMLKKEGDHVDEGETIAKHETFFGVFKSSITSPVTGRVEFISTLTGQVSVQEPPKTIEVNAYIPGRVTEILEGKGAVIETAAALVQGILGVGGERRGELMIVAPPNEPLSPDILISGCRGKILVGGSSVDTQTLVKANEVGAIGIVVGGMRRKDLDSYLGYRMGVAITGHEDLPLTLIITEGFGSLAMASRTYDLLKSLEGRQASINGATQIRAGVIRPEIIVPHSDEATMTQATDRTDSVEGIVPGMRVRIIRDPWFGSIGRVESLPPEYQRIQTESDVRVLEVTLPNGTKAVIPRANVEIIEE